MPSPTTIDFESLLAPISADEPCGPSLKDDPQLSSVYYQVKDAREAARSAERSQLHSGFEDEVASSEKPDWRKVVTLATDALATKSKDLWIAAWLIEGLTRQHGFAGVRDGFRLARELCEQYWDSIHPRPDEDGWATTVAQLAGLNGDDSEGALIAPITQIEITQGSSVDPLSGADYTDAVSLAQTTDPSLRAKRAEQGAATMDMFETAARETPPQFFANLLSDIDEAVEEFAKLTTLLDEKCGAGPDGYPAAPPSSNISNALAEARDRVRSLSGGPEAQGDADESAESDGEGDASLVAGAGQSLALPKATTREEAFQALTKVADFFRRTEPHSPVSYALEQAVRWGRMPLPDLMQELIGDDSVRRDLFRRTGIPMKQDDD